MTLVRPNFEIWEQPAGLEGIYKQIKNAKYFVKILAHMNYFLVYFAYKITKIWKVRFLENLLKRLQKLYEVSTLGRVRRNP